MTVNCGTVGGLVGLFSFSILWIYGVSTAHNSCNPSPELIPAVDKDLHGLPLKRWLTLLRRLNPHRPF